MLLALSVFLAQFAYFGLFARLDPEPHHDGVMLAAAIGVSEGKIPNKDVFTQYGPLTPLLQGMWLRLTEPTLLSLRIFTSLLLAGCGLVLFLILKSRLRLSLAVLVTFSWAVSYPFFILPVNLPWASIFATLFTLIATLTLSSAKSKHNEAKVFFVTSLLTFGIFVRIHMGISVTVIGMYCLYHWIRHKSARLFMLWSASVVVTLTLSIGLLHSIGALIPFIEQCVLWPLSYYATPAIGLTKGEIVARALLLFFPGFLFLLFLLMRLSTSSLTKGAKGTTFLMLTVSIIFLSNFSVAHKSYLNPVYVLVSLSQNFPNILAYSAVTLLFFYFWKERKKLAFFELTFLPVAIGASLIFQLYPAHDTLHLYWVAPGVIAAVVIYKYKKDDQKLSAQIFALMPVLSSIITICLVLGGLHLGVKRVEYVDPVLRGMLGMENTAEPIDSMMGAIRNLPSKSTIRFDCAHGLFAIAGGRYLASDASFVNWGTTSLQRSSDYTLICDLNESAAEKVRKTQKVLSEVALATGQIIVLVENLDKVE